MDLRSMCVLLQLKVCMSVGAVTELSLYVLPALTVRYPRRTCMERSGLGRLMFGLFSKLGPSLGQPL